MVGVTCLDTRTSISSAAVFPARIALQEKENAFKRNASGLRVLKDTFVSEETGEGLRSVCGRVGPASRV
jgi:hypothetical protein